MVEALVFDFRFAVRQRFEGGKRVRQGFIGGGECVQSVSPFLDVRRPYIGRPELLRQFFYY